jgi:hypothetical protein
MGWKDAPELSDSGGSWQDAPIVGSDQTPKVAPPTGFRALLGQAFNQTVGQMGGPLASIATSLMTPKAGIDTLEAGANALSGQVAYPLSRAAGLAGIVGDATGLVPNDPAATEQKVGNALTIQPSDPSSIQSKVVALPGQLMSGAGDLIGNLPGIKGTPYLDSIARRSPEAIMNAIGLASSLRARAAENAPPPAAAPGSPQSVGAAAAAANLQDASPELRSVAQRALQRGKFNDVAYNRQLEAESLPVPVQLMEGQATGDPALISRDMNMRAKVPGIADRLNTQNQQLAQNLEAIRNSSGEQVFSTNPVEHADTIIADYTARDAAAETRIRQLYKRLEDANGGQSPIDFNALLDTATQRLKQKLKFNHAPPEIMRDLNDLADSGGNFEDFESLRTNLAQIQRSQANGNVKAAAGIIRGAMEDLPLSSGGKDMKALADQARSMFKQHADAIEADPAYKAAVQGANPDNFVSKYIIRGARDDISTMMRDASPETRQTIRVAVLDYLKQQARLSATYEGNFSAAGYNKALEGLSAKLPLIFDAQTLEQIRSLGNVARYTTEQPRGASVNNSNTLVAGMADYGKGAAEGATNFAFGGVPVGTWIRKGAEKAGAAKTLRPGAGVMPRP